MEGRIPPGVVSPANAGQCQLPRRKDSHDFVGNLNYQIEHHLYPDMPSNRLAAIGREVHKLSKEFDLPYNVDSFPMQLWKVQKTLLKLTLPNKYLAASRDNAPEVRSNAAFSLAGIDDQVYVGERDGHRRGLAHGLALLKKARPSIKESLRYFVGATRGQLQK